MGLLPSLVLAVSLLGAIALGGALGAAALADRWEDGANAAITVQMPDNNPARLNAVLVAIRGMPEVADAQAMDQARLATLLRPWLGEVPALPLPAVIELKLRVLLRDPHEFANRLAVVAPGAAIETQGVWVARLVEVARRVEQLALAGLALVILVAVSVVVVAVRAGVAALQPAIAVLHELGATDGDIAGRFARRVSLLAGFGALLGVGLAVPVLVGFAGLAAPVMGRLPPAGLHDLPWNSVPWASLAAVPLAAVLLGWLTTQAAVRRWLRRLP